MIVAGCGLAEISGQVVVEYLDSLEVSYDVAETGTEFMLYAETETGDQWPFIYIQVDSIANACYIEAMTPAIIPESGPERDLALETIAQLNWDHPFSKFNVNPETGEISVSYTFSTESGLGFDSFATMVFVLVSTVQENAETLSDWVPTQD
jgi:hypothetical protein